MGWKVLLGVVEDEDNDESWEEPGGGDDEDFWPVRVPQSDILRIEDMKES